MNERERLVEILGQVQWNAKAEQVADALLKAGVTLPAVPTPRPVWPGLEREGLERARKLYDAAWWESYDKSSESLRLRDDSAARAAHTVLTAHLFRALVAGLPGVGMWTDRVWVGNTAVFRSALAALADPYDGGGK